MKKNSSRPKERKRMKHSKKRFLSLTKSPCGLGKTQVKDAKENHTCSKPNHHKTIRKKKRQSRKGVKKK